MRKISKIPGNKYLVLALILVTWMFFFDRNDVGLQLKRINELRTLQESEKKMDKQIADTREELKLLKTNPKTLEKYARENYLMKKENEDLYIITFDSSLIK